jgi:hypothetical protein
MTELFFIVGRGRSGTTLLARMLDRHPELCVAPEGFFVMNLQHEYGSGPWDERRIEAFCRDLVKENRMQGWRLDLSRLSSKLQERKATLTYAEVCREVYASYATDTLGRSTPKWVGDKNPHYALLVSRIERLFPRARFVHITRDYRDNIHSYQGVPFDLKDPAALAARWKAYNQAIMSVSRRMPERFLWLRFEDLLTHPEHELSRICAFLEVPFDPALLSFHEADDSGFYGKDSPWFRNLRKPLDASQASKWQGALPEQVVREAETICGPFAEGFGYAPTGRTDVSLRLSTRLRALFGYASVKAEQILFGAVPAGLRISAINTYRRLTGRT